MSLGISQMHFRQSGGVTITKRWPITDVPAHNLTTVASRHDSVTVGPGNNQSLHRLISANGVLSTMGAVFFFRESKHMLVPRCGHCDVVMDLIASRAARRRVLRTFGCRRCGNIDTVSFDRREPPRNDGPDVAI